MHGNFENEYKRKGVGQLGAPMPSWEICDAYGFYYFTLTINCYQPDMWHSIIEIMTCDLMIPVVMISDRV